MKQNEKKKRNNLELIYLDGGYYAAQDDNGQWLVMKRTQGLKGPKFIAQRTMRFIERMPRRCLCNKKNARKRKSSCRNCSPNDLSRNSKRYLTWEI